MFVFALRETYRLEKQRQKQMSERNIGAERASKRGRGVERLAEFFGDLG